MSDSILLGADSIAKQNISTSEHHLQFTFAIITMCINLTSSIPTVIINGMLLHIHIKNRKSPSRIIICNMTVTDLLTGFVVQPAYSAHIIKDLNGEFSYSVFLLFNFAAYLVCGMSLLTAGGMSIDRLFATIKPFSYKSYGKPRTYLIVVVFIWFQGVTFVSLYTAGAIDREMAQAVFMLTVSFAMVSFIVSYTIIISSMRKRERRITNASSNGALSATKRPTTQRNKITKTFALMIIALSVMYLPMFVVKILVWRSQSSQIVALNIANRLANTTTFLNSLCNPILYCYANASTKRQLQEQLLVFSGLFKGNRIQEARTERISRSNLSNAATSVM